MSSSVPPPQSQMSQSGSNSHLQQRDLVQRDMMQQRERELQQQRDLVQPLNMRPMDHGDSLVGDVRSAFGGSNMSIGSNGNGTPGSIGRSLRNDLLVAADSVTNAMSTLVRELNSGIDDK